MNGVISTRTLSISYNPGNSTSLFSAVTIGLINRFFQILIVIIGLTLGVRGQTRYSD